VEVDRSIGIFREELIEHDQVEVEARIELRIERRTIEARLYVGITTETVTCAGSTDSDRTDRILTVAMPTAGLTT
jgi:hypothetical protein